MNSHKNARLTAKGRAHLIEQIALVGLAEAACRAGISTRRARIWQQRAAEKPGELADRSSRPHASPRTTPCDKRERIVNLRRNHRLTYAVIAGRVGVSVATVGRVCDRRMWQDCRRWKRRRRRAVTSARPRANCCTWIPRS